MCGWARSGGIRRSPARPTDTPPVPAGLNWDLWLGPRQERPFHPAYFPVAWRDFWDFGCTGIGDFACHDMNTAVRAFDLPVPSRVEAHAAGLMDQRDRAAWLAHLLHLPRRRLAARDPHDVV